MKLFVPLNEETRVVVDTNCCAHHLNRRPGTLRGWAMKQGSGPIKPVRINGRLAWPVADIKRVLVGGSK